MDKADASQAAVRQCCRVLDAGRGRGLRPGAGAAQRWTSTEHGFQQAERFLVMDYVVNSSDWRDSSRWK